MTIKDRLDDFSDTQIAILLLLRAENTNGEKYSPIPTKIHLQKELFAIQQTPLGEELLGDLNFEPLDWGPYDETVSTALDDLVNAGYVILDPTSNNSVRTRLSEKGKRETDDLWEHTKENVKSLFIYSKMAFNHLSSIELLRRIYAAHPDMTKYSKSKIADRYRPKSMIPNP